MSGSRASVAIAGAVGAVVCVVLLGGAAPAQAQGCVASRMNAPTPPADALEAKDADGNSYYLPKGHWQASFGYRDYRSHRHFVGSAEQDGSPGTTDRRNNEVVNNIHLPEFAIAYGFNDRTSLTLDVPVGFLHRRNPQRAATATSPAIPYVYTDGNGLGDITLTGRYWVGQPTRGDQNLSFGLGIKLPTGQDDVSGTYLRAVNGTLQSWVHPVDQSIQPGDGGTGIIAEVQAFKVMGPVVGFASGSYLFNPRGVNGVQTGRGDPNEAVMSVADQFAARAGVTLPIRALKGLSVSVDARLEGVPAYDLIGSSAGFRRPGYSIGIEPGIAYSWQKTSLSFSVPYLVRRVRSQSYADHLATDASGVFRNGDAAFADYLIIGGFSKRF